MLHVARSSYLELMQIININMISRQMVFQIPGVLPSLLPILVSRGVISLLNPLIGEFDTRLIGDTDRGYLLVFSFVLGLRVVYERNHLLLLFPQNIIITVSSLYVELASSSSAGPATLEVLDE